MGIVPETLKRHSIERKLPLVVCLLLVLLVIGFGSFVYQEVHRLAVVAAEDRLDRVVRQLVSIAEESILERLDESRAVAEDPAIVGLAKRGPMPDAELAPPPDAVAVARLRELAEGSPQIELVAIVSPHGESLLSSPGPAASGDRPVAFDAADARYARDHADSLASEATDVRLGALTPLRVHDGGVGYEIWTPIPGQDEPIGYVVERRQMDINPRTEQLIRGLVGSQATFLYGDVDGSLWTDQRSAVEPPPDAVLLAAGPIRYRRPGGQEWIGDAERIEHTPWVLLVEQPAAAVVAPARQTMWRLAGAAGMLLLVGFAVTWLFSRRITSPLRGLTAAAKAVAEGDYSQRVHVQSRDELGILGDAFNSMAARVEGSREELESQVQQRTAKLRETLEELSEMQDELVRKEKLAVLGELSSGIGHELRNPLGVMSNAVYILKNASGELPPEAARYVAVLERQIRMAEKIIGDLLDVARVRPPERERTTVGTLVHEQLDRADLDEAIGVRVDLPTELPPVDVDPVQIGQVLLNLLNNAAQAMTGAGELIVRGRRRDGGIVELSVADSGPGVPAEHRDKIFEPLYTTKARGIGLGLSVSRSLARANGGELELADGNDTQGAVFLLTLPVADAEPAP